MSGSMRDLVAFIGVWVGVALLLAASMWRLGDPGAAVFYLVLAALLVWLMRAYARMDREA